jgi:hypothetical protein
VTAIDVAHFNTHGWLLTRTLDDAGARDLVRWVDDVAAWPEPGEGWLHYREMTDDGPKLCRTENFVPFHDGLRALLTAGTMLEIASALLGQPAVLYKEKINYKLPGGAGYSPHQDAPAYLFIDTHVSCMVAVDDSMIGNGCLEVVSDMHDEVLPMDANGCIRADLVEALEWTSIEVRAGETLWFHSRTPHRSGPNLSPLPRRALYPTYNAASEGDRRADYYRDKLAELATKDASRVNVSLIGDFQGRPVLGDSATEPALGQTAEAANRAPTRRTRQPPHDRT